MARLAGQYVAPSIAGAVSYLPSGDVRWRVGLTFGNTAGVSAFAGCSRVRWTPICSCFCSAPVMLA